MRGSSTLVRQATLLCAILAVALAVVLMAVKQQVRALEKELGRLNGQIASERQQVQVLTAEFNSFTDPEILKQQSVKHLGLVPLEPRQFATFATLDAPAAEDPAAAAPGHPPKPRTAPGAAPGAGPGAGARTGARPPAGHRSTAALGGASR